MIEEELGQPVGAVFSEITPEPVAAASLGQVGARAGEGWGWGGGGLARTPPWLPCGGAPSLTSPSCRLPLSPSLLSFPPQPTHPPLLHLPPPPLPPHPPPPTHPPTLPHPPSHPPSHPSPGVQGAPTLHWRGGGGQGAAPWDWGEHCRGHGAAEEAGWGGRQEHPPGAGCVEGVCVGGAGRMAGGPMARISLPR